MADLNLTGKLINIYDFQKGILDGTYSDAKGRAKIIINGQLSTTYLVHIDRHVVTNSSSVVSFTGLLKEYGAENIFVQYEEKEIKFPELDDFIEYRNQMKNKKYSSGPKKGSKRYV